MKYTSLIILLTECFIIQLPYIIADSITFPIKFSNSHSSIDFKGQIGISHIDVICRIDLKSSHSMIFRTSSYNNEVCPSLKLIKGSQAIEIRRNGIVYGSYSIDQFTYDGIINDLQFTFLYVTDTDYAKETIDIGYAYLSLSRTNTSFLSQLASSKVIDKRIVHFTNSSITIGDYNKTIVSQSKKMGKCNTIQSGHRWACRINKISIGSIRPIMNSISPLLMDVDDDMVFDSFAEEIIAPYHMRAFFRDHYFHDELFHHACSASEDYQEMRVVCDTEYTRTLPPLIFHLDNLAFILDNDFLFETHKNDQPRLSFRVSFTKDQTYWSFDNRILMRYNISLNDEDNTVSFYSDSGIEDDLIIINQPISNRLKIVLLNIIVLLNVVIACGCLLLFLAKYKLIKRD